MKKIWSALLAVLMLLSAFAVLASCSGQPAGPDREETPSMTQPADQPDGSGTQPETQPAVQTPVDLFLANESLWAFDLDELPAQGESGYCLLDLDFDGIPELIASMMGGSARVTCNVCYKLDLANGTVTKIQCKESKGGGGFDLYTSAEAGYPKLLRNVESGERFYLCEDFLRINSSETYSCYGKFDCLAEPRSLFSEANLPDSKQYFVYNSSYDEIEMTKEDYEAWLSEFFTENTDLHLEWKPIDAKEFSEKTAEEKKTMLLEAYEAFSYDGFTAG